jgi:hypothetical protein
MTTILALDISSNTGYSVLQEDRSILTYGNLWNDITVHEFGKYPTCYVVAAESIATKIQRVVVKYKPNIIVIEETNGSSKTSRYTQKFLEFLHCCTLQAIHRLAYSDRVLYINTSTWRKFTGIELTKEQKKQNAKLSKAKSKAGGSLTPAQKKLMGIKGKITKKHIAVAEVNRLYGLGFTQKDNDIAESILLGLAYIAGAPICDGR